MSREDASLAAASIQGSSQQGWDWGEEPPAQCRVGRSLNQGLKGGGHVESLGFSVRAEPAHRNQGQLPNNEVLGQRVSFNHEHGRGNRSLPTAKTPFAGCRTSMGACNPRKCPIKAAQSSSSKRFVARTVHEGAGRHPFSGAPELSIRLCSLSVCFEIRWDISASCCLSCICSLVILSAACSKRIN